jgi:hypothetical protein
MGPAPGREDSNLQIRDPKSRARESGGEGRHVDLYSRGVQSERLTLDPRTKGGATP